MRSALLVWSSLFLIITTFLIGDFFRVGPGQTKDGFFSSAATTLSGTVYKYKVDRLDVPVKHTDDYYLVSGTTRYKLQGTNFSSFSTGDVITVSGATSGTTFNATSAQLKQDSPINEARASVGTKKVAIILFNFTNKKEMPYTTEQAKKYFFDPMGSVNKYFNEVSYGKLMFQGKNNLSGDVYGWITIPLVSDSTCNYVAWGEAAKAQVKQSGANLTGYDQIVYGFPNVGCWWNGSSTADPGLVTNETWVEGKYMINHPYLPGQTYDATWVIFAHEIGHNIGTDHAYSLKNAAHYYPWDNTTNLRIAAATCEDGSNAQYCRTYGDPFDIMGYLPRHMSGFRKGAIGWLPRSNMTAAISPGTARYTLYPVGRNMSGLQLLVIPRFDGTSHVVRDYYYVEYRANSGLFDIFSSTDTTPNGVLIRAANHNNFNMRSSLLDMNPGDPDDGDGYIGGRDDFKNAALPVGRTFIDDFHQIKIKTIVADGTKAVIDVTLQNTPPMTFACTVTMQPTSLRVPLGGQINIQADVNLVSAGFVNKVTFATDTAANLVTFNAVDNSFPFQTRLTAAKKGTSWIKATAEIDRLLRNENCPAAQIPITVY